MGFAWEQKEGSGSGTPALWRVCLFKYHDDAPARWAVRLYPMGHDHGGVFHSWLPENWEFLSR